MFVPYVEMKFFVIEFAQFQGLTNLPYPYNTSESGVSLQN